MPQYVPEGGGEEKPFTALPPGFYNIIVDSVEAGWGQTSGQPYITWKLIVEDEDYKGSGLWHRTSMSEQAKSFPGDGFYAVLNRFGLSNHFAGRDIEFEQLVEELAEIAPGCQAVIAVSVYVFKDQDRNEVDEFFKSGEGAPPHQVFSTDEPATGEPQGTAPAPAGAAPVKRSSPQKPGRRTGGHGKSTPPGVGPPEF